MRKHVDNLSVDDLPWRSTGTPIEMIGIDDVSCFIVNFSGQGLLDGLTTAASERLDLNH